MPMPRFKSYSQRIVSRVGKEKIEFMGLLEKPLVFGQPLEIFRRLPRAVAVDALGIDEIQGMVDRIVMFAVARQGIQPGGAPQRIIVVSG